MKGRNAQVTRLYRILGILEGAPHGLTVAGLTERMNERGFEVGKRTIYRDLEALQAAGFPLNFTGKSDDQAARWTLERNMKVGHHLALSSRELLALYLARSILAPLKETPFYEDLASTFAKIEDKIGVKAHSFLQEMASEFRFEPGPQWGLGLKPEIVDTVRAACSERQILSVEYNSVSSGKKGERLLGPHFLYFAKGSLYLVAEDMRDLKVKVFGLSRMSEAKMANESYEGHITDPESYFSSSFGVYHGDQAVSVKISFLPQIASFVRERRWHQSQQIVAKSNGEVDLTMDVAVTPELVQWILGFGAQAKVIEPDDLARMVRDEALRTSAIYGTDKRRAS
jgi:predicted DNA-binding transcriptional regulator YafY